MSILLVLVLSCVFCRAYIVIAGRWHILDQPNDRSSHRQPTPHGGGVPMMLAFLVGIGLMTWWSLEYYWLAFVAASLMIVGVVDDLRGMPVKLRLALYSLAAVVTAVVMLREYDSSPALLLLVAAMAFAIAWALNLYNFMDGIDGIAAAQCILACSGAALLCQLKSADGQYVSFCLLLAASHLGFLVWNWAPAKLFMGDAGSIPTGYLLAGLACFGALSGALPFACWLVLLAIFITDATWTLVWRAATGQNFTQPHRLHAYQRLSRYWGSHSKVVWALIAIVLLWLFPLAALVQYRPQGTVYFVILAYVPLLLGMAKVSKLT